MLALSRPYGVLHYRLDGPADAPVVVMANSLGTDLRLWDAVMPLLPAGLRYLRYDKQGHGLSDLGRADRLQDHVDDVVALIEQVARGPVVMVGLSIGGLIAQRLASTRPDLVRALVALIEQPDRRDTLIARREGAIYRFDIHLQGDRETVFIDV
ncbi:alpha/beta fold hydrolase [Paracoccus hibiscisoli]|uniref:Alpha/beta fold hydrolase n=1 Tax=Paracoccus hibiscisoli TaxID=2023261 RepID=A0A4U0R8U6_9RHOB|nr:alpha/beta fold hydrolase [Paracoccus hibiscisoli]TJZ84584.1 alpha/beta fold hydrolase [Paracoccus hibiscisoli]